MNISNEVAPVPKLRVNMLTGNFRFLSVAVIISVAVLLISVACSLWIAGDERQAASNVESIVADLKASGVPVDEHTLTQFYQQLATREYTAQWLSVLDEIESPAFAQSTMGMPYLGDGAAVPLPGRRWAAQQEVEAFLGANQMLLDELHQLTRQSDPVWLPIDFDEWHVRRQALREEARLLELEHNVAVYHGDLENVLLSSRICLHGAIERQAVSRRLACFCQGAGTPGHAYANG